MFLGSHRADTNILPLPQLDRHSLQQTLLHGCTLLLDNRLCQYFSERFTKAGFLSAGDSGGVSCKWKVAVQSREPSGGAGGNIAAGGHSGDVKEKND